VLFVRLEPPARGRRHFVILVKKSILLVLALASSLVVLPARASDTRDWDYIKRTGGLRIAEPVTRDGKLFLPVEYDASGTKGAVEPPEITNTGLAVRKVDVRQKKVKYLVVRIITEPAGKGRETERMHYGRLPDLSPGTYEVYYETPGDPEKYLGNVEIK
jgi:hypothetical protein